MNDPDEMFCRSRLPSTPLRPQLAGIGDFNPVIFSALIITICLPPLLPHGRQRGSPPPTPPLLAVAPWARALIDVAAVPSSSATQWTRTMDSITAARSFTAPRTRAQADVAACHSPLLPHGCQRGSPVPPSAPPLLPHGRQHGVPWPLADLLY